MSHRCVFYYDTRSNLACVRDPDLGLTYYAYDAGSRMTSVQNPFGEVTYYCTVQKMVGQDARFAVRTWNRHLLAMSDRGSVRRCPCPPQ